MSLAPFAVAQDVADRLGRTLTALETTQATAALTDASALIRDHLRQNITLSSSTMLRESPDGPWLDLPQRPVVSIQSVAVNGNTVTDWSQIGDRLYRVYGWRWPSVDTIPPLAIYGLKSTVTVTYLYGYSTIPDVIVTVCRNMALRFMLNPSGLVSESIDDYSAKRDTADSGVVLTDEDRKALRRFRRPAFSVQLGSQNTGGGSW